MGVTETLRILLTIFLTTACIQNVRLFGVYGVRWPFLAEIHTALLKRFVPSSVLQAVRALRNAPAALVVFLAGVAPMFLNIPWGRATVQGEQSWDNTYPAGLYNTAGKRTGMTQPVARISRLCMWPSHTCSISTVCYLPFTWIRLCSTDNR